MSMEWPSDGGMRYYHKHKKNRTFETDSKDSDEEKLFARFKVFDKCSASTHEAVKEP